MSDVLEGGFRVQGIDKQRSQDKPLITIITVVLNALQHLEQAIESVLQQPYDNVEYIIIDGGSIDGTIEIIKKYDKMIDYWISERDNGIYDAMNKGLALATGDLVAFLNGDDWYEPDALQLVASEWRLHRDAGLIYGNVRLVGTNENIVFGGDAKEFGKNLHHQSCFFKTSVHKELPYDLSYRLAADKDCITSILKSGISAYHLKALIVNYRRDGASSGLFKYQLELFASRKKHFGLLRALYMTGRSILIRILFRVFKGCEKKVIERKKN